MLTTCEGKRAKTLVIRVARGFTGRANEDDAIARKQHGIFLNGAM